MVSAWGALLDWNKCQLYLVLWSLGLIDKQTKNRKWFAMVLPTGNLRVLGSIPKNGRPGLVPCDCTGTLSSLVHSFRNSSQVWGTNETSLPILFSYVMLLTVTQNTSGIRNDYGNTGRFWLPPERSSSFSSSFRALSALFHHDAPLMCDASLLPC